MNQLSCPFSTNHAPSLASNQLAFAILDRRPVSSGHCLVISRSHVRTIFDLSVEEYLACFQFVRELKEVLAKEKHTESFPIVVNSGPDANQTVRHAHIHVVPRYPGANLPPESDAWWSVR